MIANRDVVFQVLGLLYLNEAEFYYFLMLTGLVWANLLVIGKNLNATVSTNANSCLCVALPFLQSKQSGITMTALA